MYGSIIEHCSFSIVYYNVASKLQCLVVVVDGGEVHRVKFIRYTLNQQ